MPDICDLILDDHEHFRRRFAELDELHSAEAVADRLKEVWAPLADRLDLHAAAEEAIFYPMLLEEGVRAEEETSDAVSDHNDIRDAVRRAAEVTLGSGEWWSAVDDAREANSGHMAEEERGAIADARRHAPDERRTELGARFVRFGEEHAGMRSLEARDKDPAAYVRAHRAS